MNDDEDKTYHYIRVANEVAPNIFSLYDLDRKGSKPFGFLVFLNNVYQMLDSDVEYIGEEIDIEKATMKVCTDFFDEDPDEVEFVSSYHYHGDYGDCRLKPFDDETGAILTWNDDMIGTVVSTGELYQLNLEMNAPDIFDGLDGSTYPSLDEANKGIHSFISKGKDIIQKVLSPVEN